MTAASATNLLAAAAAYLLIKHAIADFFLQTAFQWRNKGEYGHPGGVIHVTIHALLTLPVFLIMQPPTLQFAALILFGEALVHYHIDWFKDRVVKQRQWTITDNSYWRALGFDQLLHGLTYIGIVWVLGTGGL